MIVAVLVWHRLEGGQADDAVESSSHDSAAQTVDSLSSCIHHKVHVKLLMPSRGFKVFFSQQTRGTSVFGRFRHSLARNCVSSAAPHGQCFRQGILKCSLVSP